MTNKAHATEVQETDLSLALSLLQPALRLKDGVRAELIEAIPSNRFHHSVCEGFEFLFKHQSQLSILKGPEVKNWFLYEDYQLKILRFLKLYGGPEGHTTGPYTIFRVMMTFEKQETEVVIVASNRLLATLPPAQRRAA